MLIRIIFSVTESRIIQCWSRESSCRALQRCFGNTRMLKSPSDSKGRRLELIHDTPRCPQISFCPSSGISVEHRKKAEINKKKKPKGPFGNAFSGKTVFRKSSFFGLKNCYQFFRVFSFSIYRVTSRTPYSKNTLFNALWRRIIRPGSPESLL